MLNKTNPVEKGGNMFLAMNVESNGAKDYTKWSMPTVTKHNIKSQTDNPVSPEIIDIQGAQLKKVCKGSSSCVLVFMVYGQSNIESRYRLHVLKGQNKLHQGEPLLDVVNPGEFKYYWFVSTKAIFATKENPDWKHEIGVGVKTPGADVDMYVSLFDGRYPTLTDYDLASTNKGSDQVVLKSTDPAFSH